MSMHSTTVVSDYDPYGKVKESLFDYGIQYYVCARSGYDAGLTPIPGHLFHHAIEIFIKGNLTTRHSLEDMKKKFRHALGDLWDSLKTEVCATNLDEYDSVVDKLNEFEEIRYPDFVLQRGMVCSIGGLCNPSGTAMARTPYYELPVSDLINLTKALFRLASMNPEFFLPNLSDNMAKYVQELMLCAPTNAPRKS